MSFLNWIFRRTPDDTDPAPPAPKAIEGPPVSPPDDTIPDTQDMLQGPDDYGEIMLDELYCLIDYCDAKGHETRRRITLLKIKNGPNAPILSAICHERKALRHFRFDRIECFIDDDGVVTPADEFARDTLLVDIGAFNHRAIEDQPANNAKAASSEHKDDPFAVAQSLRNLLRAPLSILVAAAKVDGQFHAEEHDVICCYAEEEAEELLKNGEVNNVRIEDLDALNRIIPKMRPRRGSAEEHLTNVLTMSDERFDRFKRALSRVILADGIIHPDEQGHIDLLADLDDMRRQLR
ncbi:hypothetical protein [Roseovarius pacificus]|uniref:tellurite resistance TerB family protein n=1 Tax=Roseovarius pacificus TaxID=337701 RepID=UPI002A18C136|nr:hypothetical protein [Roseovarius pacificus]